MKKTKWILLFAACSTYFILTSYNSGPAANGWDCTGAETGLGNPTGCTNGGCHGTAATSGITVSIELDSVGVPTTHYVGGMSYTVKITGTNGTNSTLPRFGLQMGCIRGSTAVTTPTNAGTWNAPFPAGTHFSAPQAGLFVVGLVEQTSSLAATTGTGGNGSTYVETFHWTAPAAGTGTISFWGAVNAVNNNTNADAGDKWNLHHVPISEWTVTSGIADASAVASAMIIFPNPAGEKATISFTNISPSIEKGEIRVMDISGKTVRIIPVADFTKTEEVDCTDFANGIYFFSLVANDAVVVTRKVVIAK